MGENGSVSRRRIRIHRRGSRRISVRGRSIPRRGVHNRPADELLSVFTPAVSSSHGGKAIRAQADGEANVRGDEEVNEDQRYAGATMEEEWVHAGQVVRAL